MAVRKRSAPRKDLRATIRVLAKKQSRMLRLYPGEGWPLELEMGKHTGYSVEIN